MANARFTASTEQLLIQIYALTGELLIIKGTVHFGQRTSQPIPSGGRGRAGLSGLWKKEDKSGPFTQPALHFNLSVHGFYVAPGKV